jgi:hypothetical protein
MNTPNWNDAVANTKVFPVVHRLLYNTKHLQGCRNCNGVTTFTGMVYGRQLLGNCYQTLTVCSVCGNGLVLDEHNLRNIELFLTQKP